MKIQITKEQAEAVGLAKFKAFGVDKERWGFRSAIELDLATMSKAKTLELDALLSTVTVTGIRGHRADIATWLAAVEDASQIRPRTVRSFETLLVQHLLKTTTARRWVFMRDKASDTWVPYYVNRVVFHPEERSRGNYTPAFVEVLLVWQEYGGQKQRTIRFDADDLRGRTVVQVLAESGVYTETDAMLATYRAHLDRFLALHPKIGQQCLCTGFASDGVDGNPQRRHDSWYWRSSHTLPMVRNGEPSKVVVDVFNETREGREETVHLDSRFWVEAANGRRNAQNDEPEEEGDDPIDLETAPIDVPIHPNLIVFDLQKHLRLAVHVDQLREYVYDEQMADKLVLPDHRKALVRMLVEMKSGGFTDIVRGKSGGAVVLLAGAPGTGKTLTAEVYAESEQRALYSVQCSQLGTDPTELEEELLKVFTRAARWKAVLLLDEADVYVHARGNDMQQNAVVGVFLRVLEYQDTVLFLTTNRPDDVDDAIASRCIARLSYDTPSKADQCRIWRVLCDTTGTPITDTAIADIVTGNPQLTGRDVKNLLKLARLITPDGITPESIEFVKQFKPTGNPTTVAAGNIGQCQGCGRLVGKRGHVCTKAVTS